MNTATLMTRYARRPLLLEPTAARALLQHIAAGDPRGMGSEGRFEALLRRIGIGREPARAMEDADDGDGANPVRLPDAYAPLWALQTYGEPSHEGFAWCLFEGVATLEINTALGERGEYFCGVWYHGYDTVLAALREAVADERVKAVFIRIASPGGVVAGGLPALAAFMRGARASAGGKPIHVYADMACSAAYWIAAQADRIAGPRVGLIGSIGAVLVHEDWSKALKKMGVVITPIQFGGQKTAGAWWEALSAEAAADLHAEIDQCGRDFVADVAAGRPLLTPEALIATQARVFLGHHDEAARSAQDLGFLDDVMSEEDAFAQLLADIAPTISAPAPGSPPVAAETGSRGGGKTAKEEPMAPRTAIKGPKAQATEPEDDKVTDTGAETPADEPADEEDDEAVAAPAIAESAEARAHPHLALAAIQSGQTLAQFRANVAAIGNAPKTGKLDAAMAGSARLGADAPAASTAQPDLSASAIYAARRQQHRR